MSGCLELDRYRQLDAHIVLPVVSCECSISRLARADSSVHLTLLYAVT